MRSSGCFNAHSSLHPLWNWYNGKEARKFVDFLINQVRNTGRSFQSVRPAMVIHHISHFPVLQESFILFDLEILCREKLLKKAECESFPWGSNPHYVDYGVMYNSRYALLKKSLCTFHEKTAGGFCIFL